LPRARSDRTDGSTGLKSLASEKRSYADKALEEGLRSLGYRVGENVVTSTASPTAR